MQERYCINAQLLLRLVTYVTVLQRPNTVS
jgi:hypothetical protein